MSEEVTNPQGLGFRQAQDPATLAAWQEGMSLKDKTVYDVNGREMGKVTRAFAENGALLRVDVTLTNQAKRLFGTTQDVAGFPPIAIADVTEESVRLSEAGQQILHPDGYEGGDTRGARDLPRKER